MCNNTNCKHKNTGKCPLAKLGEQKKRLPKKGAKDRGDETTPPGKKKVVQTTT